MNPQSAELVGTSDQPIDKSPWHLALRVQKREREAADRRVAEAEQRERAAAEQRERALMVRLLTPQGVATAALESCDIETLRRMLDDQG